jgi:glutamate carboxypeptidase
MKSTVRLALLSFCAAALGATAQGLSPPEQRIVASVKERSEAALQFLEKTVRVNSGTLNVEGVRETGRLFGAELESLGFKVRWVEMPPEMQRAGHLVAERTGARGKRLLLLGHLDTVFEKSSAVPKWDRQGDRVRGQGVNDMKGGNVIILEALRALKREGALDDTTITVYLTGDEERMGAPATRSRQDMLEVARRSDVALSFEATSVRNGKNMAVIGRRASGGWILRVQARPGHSSGVFSADSGFGAIYEGARILNAFRENVIEPDLTFNAGIAAGGTTAAYDEKDATASAFGKSNVIAQHFVAVGDFRYLDHAQRDRAQARMREIVAQSLPHAKATITFREGYPPMSPTPGNLRLLELYSQASADAGLGTFEAFPPGERGAGDVQWVAPLLDSLDGIGPLGRGSHTDNEDLEIASIEAGAVRAAIMIYRLTR